MTILWNGGREDDEGGREGGREEGREGRLDGLPQKGSGTARKEGGFLTGQSNHRRVIIGNFRDVPCCHSMVYGPQKLMRARRHVFFAFNYSMRCSCRT
jgi:hypothetical protein